MVSGFLKVKKSINIANNLKKMLSDNRDKNPGILLSVSESVLINHSEPSESYSVPPINTL